MLIVPKRRKCIAATCTAESTLIGLLCYLISLFVQEGVGYFDMTVKDGHRWSASDAYLHPALKSRLNLSVTTGAMVTRVLFDKTRAIAVEYLKDGQLCEVCAKLIYFC